MYVQLQTNLAPVLNRGYSIIDLLRLHLLIWFFAIKLIIYRMLNTFVILVELLHAITKDLISTG